MFRKVNKQGRDRKSIDGSYLEFIIACLALPFSLLGHHHECKELPSTGV